MEQKSSLTAQLLNSNENADMPLITSFNNHRQNIPVSMVAYVLAFRPFHVRNYAHGLVATLFFTIWQASSFGSAKTGIDTTTPVSIPLVFNYEPTLRDPFLSEKATALLVGDEVISSVAAPTITKTDPTPEYQKLILSMVQVIGVSIPVNGTPPSALIKFKSAPVASDLPPTVAPSPVAPPAKQGKAKLQQPPLEIWVASGLVLPTKKIQNEVFTEMRNIFKSEGTLPKTPAPKNTIQFPIDSIKEDGIHLKLPKGKSFLLKFNEKCNTDPQYP